MMERTEETGLPVWRWLAYNETYVLLLLLASHRMNLLWGSLLSDADCGAMVPCLGNREPIDYGSMPSTTTVALKEYTVLCRQERSMQGQLVSQTTCMTFRSSSPSLSFGLVLKISARGPWSVGDTFKWCCHKSGVCIILTTNIQFNSTYSLTLLAMDVVGECFDLR